MGPPTNREVIPSQERRNREVCDWVIRAQRGDRAAREKLLREYLPFVLKVAASASRRYVKIGEDEEVSIALCAFDEAISDFRAGERASFLTFAEMVIRRRLIDHFRRTARRRREIPMAGLTTENEDETESNRVVFLAEVRDAMRNYTQQLEARERREEIMRFKERLAEFDIRFDDLVKDAPKHSDTRLRSMGIASLVSNRPEYRSYLLKRRSLPLKDLENEAGVSRKTLERHRKYIIAIALILIGEFTYLREYIKLE